MCFYEQREREIYWNQVITLGSAAPQHDESTPYGRASADIAKWNDRYKQLQSRDLLEGDDPAVDLTVTFLQENQDSALTALQTEGLTAYEADVAKYQRERQFYEELVADAKAKSSVTLERRAGIAAIMPELTERLQSLATPEDDEALVNEAQEALAQLEKEYAHLYAPWSIPRSELRSAVEATEVSAETYAGELAVAGLAGCIKREGYEHRKPDATEGIVCFLASNPGKYFTVREMADVIYDHVIPEDKRYARAATALWSLRNGGGSERAKGMLKGEGWGFERAEVPKDDSSELGRSAYAYRLMKDDLYDIDIQNSPAADELSVVVESATDMLLSYGEENDTPQKNRVELAVEDAARHYGSLLDAGIDPGASVDYKTVRRIFGGVGKAGTATAYRRLVEAGVLKKSAGKIRANMPLPDLSVPQVLFMRIFNSHEDLKNRKGDILRFLETVDEGYRAAWENYRESSKR